MYCAITPRTKIVIEKQRTIAAIRLPNPANGTPKITQKIVNPVSEKTESKEEKTPKIETHASGSVLYANMLWNP
jgi:hypothetical protein